MAKDYRKLYEKEGIEDNAQVPPIIKLLVKDPSLSTLIQPAKSSDDATRRFPVGPPLFYSQNRSRLPSDRSKNNVTYNLIDDSILNCDSDADSNDSGDDTPSTYKSNKSCKSIERFKNSPKNSLCGSILAIVKTVVGSGCLSLSAGVGAYATSIYSLIPALMLTILMGSISGYTFTLLAKSCEMTGTSNMGSTWKRTVGPNSLYLVNIASGFMACSGCICYMMIIGDSTSKIFQYIDIHPFLEKRGHCILIWTVFLLLPLSMKDKFVDLNKSSTLGVCGIILTCVVVILRHFDGTYNDIDVHYGSIEHNNSTVVEEDQFSIFSGFSSLNLKFFILCSMLFTSFNAHYSAGTIYYEIKDRSITRLNLVAFFGFGISTFLCMICMSMGFLTFGKSVHSDLLENYNTDDFLITLSRVGMTLSITGSFPILFIALRDKIFSFCGYHDLQEIETQTKTYFNFTVVFLLMSIAISTQNLGFFIAFFGAVFGSSVTYLFPTTLFIYCCQLEDEKDKAIINYSNPISDRLLHLEENLKEENESEIAIRSTRSVFADSLSRTTEINIARCIFCLGVGFGIIGANTVIYTTFFNKS